MSRFALASWVGRWREGPGVPSLIFGVWLPIATILFELVTRWCASLLFDPLPTLFHVVLVTLVPALNLLTWSSFSNIEPRPHLLSLCNGIAVGIAAFYSIMFLPVLPLATVGIMFFGLGLLAWAPLLSLIAAISLQLHLRRAAAAEHRRYLMWPGLLCGVLALVAVDLPTTITQVGVRMATSQDSSEQARGLRVLRAVGNEDLMLRLCYVRTGRTTDMASFITGMRSVDPADARKIFYRVTGEPFNSRLAPTDLRRRRAGFADGLDFDDDQGTDVIGGQLKGLALASSRIDGSLDANSALGYLEWTLVLKNDASIVREGRAQIALPPGAVVSRLTLWVDGEEREAAFAARGQVTSAYRAVVSQRRDPVLVTTAGPDRISVQMFPVPANGEMKVRIGMTVPMQLRTLREGTLRLPYFHERNFTIPPALRHSVWIESKAALRSELGQPQRAETGYSLQLQLADEQLSDRDSTIGAPRDGPDVSWSSDLEPSRQLIQQTLQLAPAQRPSRAVIVVDSSASMAGAAERIAASIERLPSQVPLFLVIADDDRALDFPTPPIGTHDAAALLRSHSFEGGSDNTAALARALDIAMAAPDSALIWIHGPQPVLFQTNEAIEQRLLRGRRDFQWYDLQVAPGRNLVSEGLDERYSIATLSVAELDVLLARWGVNGKQVLAARERVDGPLEPASAHKTSTHLARLWAHDEVERLLHRRAPERRAAIELAHHYQLVTPVTGAVVLETQQQYDAAGLSPVPEGTVPTIPEPEEWALMLIAVAVLLYAYRRHRRQSAYAAA